MQNMWLISDNRRFNVVVAAVFDRIDYEFCIQEFQRSKNFSIELNTITDWFVKPKQISIEMKRKNEEINRWPKMILRKWTVHTHSTNKILNTTMDVCDSCRHLYVINTFDRTLAKGERKTRTENKNLKRKMIYFCSRCWADHAFWQFNFFFFYKKTKYF